MGNSTGLAYDVGNPIEYTGKLGWTLHEGSKQAVDKDDMKENVTLFRINSTKALPPNDLLLVQRNIQKLRTLKHPFVLKFIESAEMDDSLALVTEPCIPLDTWLQQQLAVKEDETTQAKQEQDLQLQELLWGLKCILLAMNFLHTNCTMIHGNLSTKAIFVTPNGDWKLGSLELAGNMMAGQFSEDVEHFTKFHHLLDATYCSPERQQMGSNAPAVHEVLQSRSPDPPAHLDVYSFGQCIQRVFNTLDLDMPRSFGKYLNSMLHVDAKKRPSAKKLCQCAMFNSEHLQFIESIGELSLKTPKEFLEVVSKLEPKLVGLSRAVCAHKILPNLCRTLQIAINDFPLRDAREACRQSVQVSVNLLCRLASLNKLEDAVFRQNCVPILVQLWSMGDRTVRTVMLQSLKPLVPLIPAAVVNKSVFDNVIAGFADSNAKLRESTLMSLIFIVDKLDETQLQERLVRAISNLQNDAEASIRTNATIFLGKIAVRLKEGVRARVLSTALQKAMKDNFLHCRIAGLKTANACVRMLEVAHLATKIIPQASILALDKSGEVRGLALALLTAGVEILKENSDNMAAKAKTEDSDRKSGTGGAIGGIPSKSSNNDAAGQKNQAEIKPATTAAAGAGGGGSSTSESSWGTWLSKSIESATILKEAEGGEGAYSNSSNNNSTNSSSTTIQQTLPVPVSSSAIGNESSLASGHSSTGSMDAAAVGMNTGSNNNNAPKSTASLRQQEQWDDMLDDLDIGEDEEDAVDDADDHELAPSAAAWNDDDLGDLDDDDDISGTNVAPPLSSTASTIKATITGNSSHNNNNNNNSSSSSSSSISRSTGSTTTGSNGTLRIGGIDSKKSASNSGGTGGGAAATATAAKEKKPAVKVKKLAVSKDDADWDDF